MKKAIILAAVLSFPVTVTAHSTSTDYVNGVVDGTYYTTLLQIAKQFTIVGVPRKEAIGAAAKCAGTKANVVTFVVENFGASLKDNVTFSVALSETMYARCEKQTREIY